MVVRMRVERGAYVDSVKLMLVARALAEQAGVEAADAVMATPANLERLREADLLGEEVSAGPNDLLLCVRAADEACGAAALDAALAWLRQRPVAAPGGPVASRTVAAAAARAPGANVAVVSVPGAYAALEAEEALEAGLHVFLFSDNVALEDEVRLKALADERGLLVMGPDCGTSIIGGRGLGFANAVRPGPVGIVGASGTGIQQVACLLDAAGVGLSHAIGTGSRDLSAAVGGRTMLRALALLADDPATRVIVLISKPPEPAVADAVLRAAAATDKPVVACLLGAKSAEAPPGVAWAPTLAAAADLAADLVGQESRDDAAARPGARGGPEKASTEVAASTAAGGHETRPYEFAGGGANTAPQSWGVRSAPPAPQSWGEPGSALAVRGLFAGGTLAQEALMVLRAALGGVESNLESAPSGGSPHRLIDYGADEYTVGRPHPMIDQALRLQALGEAASDPSVGVVLLDVILGYGAHPDPAGELGPAVEQAIATARAAGRTLAVVVSLCGAAGDPQGLAAQRARLEAVGAQVRTRNLEAAELAASLALGRRAAEVRP
jgi:FdrA protein